MASVTSIGRVGRVPIIGWTAIPIGALGCGGSKATPRDAGAMDAAAPGDGSGTVPGDGCGTVIIPAGDHFCQTTNTGEAIWTQGYEGYGPTRC
jgi:hypothetical protein